MASVVFRFRSQHQAAVDLLWTSKAPPVVVFCMHLSESIVPATSDSDNINSLQTLPTASRLVQSGRFGASLTASVHVSLWEARSF